MEVSTYQNGPFSFVYCDEPFTLAPHTVDSLRTHIERFLTAFPQEATYVQHTYGVPALTIRFDGVLDADGSFIPYEAQPAGAGIGYAAVANPAFKETRDHFLRNVWPPFKLVQNVKLELDDEMWLERITLDEAVRSTDLLQLRHPLDTLNRETALNLIARSIKPVRFTISKSYGETLGWWRKISFDSESEQTLPWSDGFALKPLWGWGSYDIMIAHPEGRPGGSATRSQILRTFEKQKEMYLQPFIAPMQKEIQGVVHNMILRPYFGYDTVRKTWVPWGGTWNARPAPTLRIHGAQDAIAGPLVLTA